MSKVPDAKISGTEGLQKIPTQSTVSQGLLWKEIIRNCPSMLLFFLNDLEFSPSLRAEELAFPSHIFREA